MIKLSDHLYIEPMGRVLERNRAERRRASAIAHRRDFAAAKISRLNNGWVTYSTTANSEVRVALSLLRARSRQLYNDDPHFKKYETICVSNTVGRQGIRLQCRAYKPDGKTLDRKLNKYIEQKFWEWGHREHCSASGTISWVGYQQLVMKTVPRDGGALFQKIRDKSKFGLKLKQIDVSYLDEMMNKDLQNGNRIIMGVEVDEHYKPLAYWLRTPPSDTAYTRERNREPVRVPASEIIFVKLPGMDESQVRELPWGHAAMVDAKNLVGYKDGVITSARIAANWVGFIEQDASDDVMFEGEEDAETGVRKNIEIDNRPGQINLLDPGMKVNQLDPKQPTQNHEMFYKSMVRDVAIGLPGSNYFSLQGDWAEVNLSSGRLGLNEERDFWRAIQTNLLGDLFCREVYHAWLTEAMISGDINITPRQYAELQNPTWRGRGWDYMDPAKEISSTLDAIHGNLMTYTQFYAEKGLDLVDVLEEKQQEMALFADAGVEYMPERAPKTAPSNGQPDDTPPDETKPKTDDTANGTTNE